MVINLSDNFRAFSKNVGHGKSKGNPGKRSGALNILPKFQSAGPKHLVKLNNPKNGQISTMHNKAGNYGRRIHISYQPQLGLCDQTHDKICRLSELHVDR